MSTITQSRTVFAVALAILFVCSQAFAVTENPFAGSGPSYLLADNTGGMDKQGNMDDDNMNGSGTNNSMDDMKSRDGMGMQKKDDMGMEKKDKMDSMKKKDDMNGMDKKDDMGGMDNGMDKDDDMDSGGM